MSKLVCKHWQHYEGWLSSEEAIQKLLSNYVPVIYIQQMTGWQPPNSYPWPVHKEIISTAWAGYQCWLIRGNRHRHTHSCKTKVQPTQEKAFAEPHASEGLHRSHSLPSIPISSCFVVVFQGAGGRKEVCGPETCSRDYEMEPKLESTSSNFSSFPRRNEWVCMCVCMCVYESYPTHFCLPQKDLKLKVTQQLSSIAWQVGGRSRKEMNSFWKME